MKYTSTLLSAFLAHQAFAYPSSELAHRDSLGSADTSSSQLQSRADKVPIRLLPLGASIVYGAASTDENGFRKHIRDQLRYAGYPVNMIGSRQSGKMKDNDVEGWPGFRIAEVHDRAKNTLKFKPNLVLLNAGTNDCVQTFKLDAATDRMEALVEDIFKKVDGVTVVMSGLIHNAKHDSCSKRLSKEYHTLFEKLQKKGRKVVFADTFGDHVGLHDLADGTHPNDFGYKKLATAFWKAIQDAEKKKFITAPLENGCPNDQAMATCKDRYDKFKDDAVYKHCGNAVGNLIEFKDFPTSKTAQDIWFADIDGDGKDDLIWHKDPKENPGHFLVWTGAGKYKLDPITIDVKTTCKPEGIRWGDMDGDHVADFICIATEGDMYASVNRGGNRPQFLAQKEPVKKSPSTASFKNVRLGDIDGDGMIDYCTIEDNGDVRCWRNKGKGESWDDLGVVFEGKSKANVENGRFVDLNGDGRADWLFVAKTGAINTWINMGAANKTSAPEWQSIGISHWGVPSVKDPADVFIARVAGTTRGDYVEYARTPVKEGSNKYKHYLKYWKNDGLNTGTCPQASEDDGKIVDPKLPELTAKNPHPKGQGAKKPEKTQKGVNKFSDSED